MTPAASTGLLVGDYNGNGVVDAADYSVWRACERLGIRPPEVKESWDDCSVCTQALILAFDQVASHDEAEWESQLAGARMP
jgi:hypothetical protein